MAYNPYTADQINSEIKRLGLENDHWGQYNLVKQYNVDPAVYDAARGLAAGTTAGWSANAQKELAGPIANTRGLADTNPQMAYALAQQRGFTGNQADSLYGKGAGTSANFASQYGLTGLGSTPAATMPPIGGAAPPVNNSPANPYLSPSTAGSTPAPMPNTGGGTMGVPDYLVAPSSYMPAGGQGSNFSNDPRMGGPSGWGPSWMKGGPMGNQGFGGLTDYLFQNPSTMAMGNEVTRQVNNNLQRNILPGIRGNAMAAGTVGGSRQGVAEGLATGEAMTGLAGALANLYGNQFNQDRGYELQSDALDFNIHRGNLQDMRQGQMDQLGFINQMNNWGQQGIGIANQTRDRPFTDWQRFVGPASQMAGLGSQQTQNLQGNPYLGALGGYMTGSKMFGG